MTATIVVNPVSMKTIIVNGAPGGGDIDEDADYEWGGIHIHTPDSSSIWQTLGSDANTTITHDSVTLTNDAGVQLELTPDSITIDDLLLTKAVFEGILEESDLRSDADDLLQTAIDDEIQARSDADALLQLKSEKGVANGYAGLTSGGVLDDAIIPSGITRDAELVATVNAAVALIMGGLPPGTLDSLVELATAINNDPAFSTTITALVNAKVALDLYNANTVLAATTDNNPIAVSIGEGTILGRLVGGNIAALSAANLKTILSLSAADISGLATVATTGSAADLTGTLSIARLADNSLTNAKSVQMAATTIKGNPTAATADQIDISMAAGTILARLSAGTTIIAATKAQIQDLLEGYTNHGSLGGAVNLSFAGSRVQAFTPSLNTTLSFTGGASGTYQEILVIFTQHASSAKTLSWDSAIKWDGGQAPVASTVLGAIDHYLFYTVDGGTTVIGSQIVKGAA